MRYTLEQLKAMSDKELLNLWSSDGGNQFPFDISDCGHCLTLHALEDVQCHPEIKKALETMESGMWPWMWTNLGPMLKKHIEELYALRLFYDHLYPQPVEQEQAAERNEQARLQAYEMRTGERE